MKAITIRVEDNFANFLQNIGSSHSETTRSLAEMAAYSARKTIGELKGVFSEKELFLILSRYNGYIPNYEMDCSVDIFVIVLQEYKQHELLDYEVDFDVLIEKSRKLTSFQITVLVRECNRFWYDETADFHNNIEKFMKKFI